MSTEAILLIVLAALGPGALGWLAGDERHRRRQQRVDAFEPAERVEADNARARQATAERAEADRLATEAAVTHAAAADCA